MQSHDNETWIVEAGAAVIQTAARAGLASLSPIEALIYRIWEADYSMRNAGDLEAFGDGWITIQLDALRLAEELSLRFTYESFSLPKLTLQNEYFKRFDRICDEVKKVAN